MAEKTEETFEQIGRLYQDLIDAGVPAEDARFVLPNATSTNFKVVVNFQEMLHICDLRLCTRAQWEFRKVAALMRSEINKRFPELGRYLQPKCGERRWGYCDEDYAAWEACPIGRTRPHKRDLFQLFDSYRKGELIPLNESDFKLIEKEETGVP
jgi:thymidylate synthase (FAD)